MAQTLPASFTPSLLHLQQMLHQFWRDELKGKSLPVEFWKIDDENIFFDALQYLPSCTFVYGGPRGQGHQYSDLANFPRGLQIAVAIFELEDQMSNDGWTAFGNLGEERLREVVAAYREAGLVERAATLDALINCFVDDPENEDALSAAAGEAFPELIDDEENSAKLLRYLRSDTQETFGNADL